MNSQRYFEKKTIFITGGSSGIGYALAERIVQFKPKAIVLLSHEKQKLDAAINCLKQTAVTTVEFDAYKADIGNSEETRTACKEMIARFGAPDILINNAGYAHYLMFHEMSDEEIVRHADVNLIGAMRVVHALLPAMRAAKKGQIVNVASIAGHMIITPNLVYGAAKHGMVAWSEGLNLELAGDGIFVQTISPGRVLTDFFRHESFQKRVAGSETRLTVSMKKIVDISINAIVKRKKLTIVPQYWSFIAWALRSFPIIVKPLYHHVLRKRIDRLKSN